MKLHRIGSGGLLPDLTVLIEVSPQDSALRLGRRDAAGTDRIGGREAAYHAAVSAAFVRFAQAEPQRFARIDGNGPVEQSHALILAALSPLLESA